MNATSAGGEVDALDPAGYGPITISKAITIEGQGWSYIAPPAGGNGITINAQNGDVAIHGVSLNGAGITGNNNGIVLNSGGSLTVTDCVVQNFTGDGILIQPSGAQTINGTIERVRAINNLYGIYVNGQLLSGGGINVAISNSLASNNSANGITFQTTSARTVGSVQNSTIANNHVGLSVLSANMASNGGCRKVSLRLLLPISKDSLQPMVEQYTYQDRCSPITLLTPKKAVRVYAQVGS